MYDIPILHTICNENGTWIPIIPDVFNDGCKRMLMCQKLLTLVYICFIGYSLVENRYLKSINFYKIIDKLVKSSIIF